MEQETKYIPTKEQVEILMSDWLGNLRDEGTYVHKNVKGAINRSIGMNEGISNYIIGDVSQMNPADILKQAREIAQNTVDAMTSVPTKVRVGGDQSYRNGQDIVVATDFFDKEGITLNEKIEILMGMAVHEASHVNYTDSDKKRTLIESYPQNLQNLVKDIWNTLEDERIEYLTGEERPGLSGPLASAKRYVFDILKNEESGQPLTDPVAKFLNCLLYGVRYPASMDEKDVIDNFEELNAIRRTLTPFPLSPEGTIEATKRVMDIIRDIVKKDLEQQQQEQEQQQQDQNGGQQNQQQSGNGQGNQQNNQTPSKADVDKALEQSLNGQQVKQVLQAMETAQDAPEGGTNGNNASCTKNQNENAFINGDVEKDTDNGPGGSGCPTYIKRAKGNRFNYDCSVRRVNRFIPSMTRALTYKTEEKDYELRGEKSGKLNTFRLVALKTGNTNIFTKQGSVTCDSACICILIDESGSMNTEKVNAARDTAVLINEAVKHINNLELFVYGYTSNQLQIFHERKNADKYAIGSNSSQGGTPTGDAMRIVGKRIRKLTDSNCLMFVLTDGCSDDKTKVQEQDVKLRRAGIIPIGIGIAGSQSVKNEFKDNIVVNNLVTLAPELGKIVKKRLLKSLRTHDSMGD